MNHAEVTGRSGDGGIDGKGIARMAGVLSFHVVFQCKRYQGAVSASQVPAMYTCSDPILGM